MMVVNCFVVVFDLHVGISNASQCIWLINSLKALLIYWCIGDCLLGKA